MSTDIVATPSSEITDLIQKLDPVLRDQPMATVIAACFAIIFVAQAPTISPDELIHGINGSSKWVTDYIESLPSTPTNDMQLNLPFTLPDTGITH